MNVMELNLRDFISCLPGYYRHEVSGNLELYSHIRQRFDTREKIGKTSMYPEGYRRSKRKTNFRSRKFK